MPTIDRGFYFTHESSLQSTDLFQPSPVLNLQLWLYPLEEGNILVSSSVSISFFITSIEVTAYLRSQIFPGIQAATLSIPSSKAWNYLNINILQISAWQVLLSTSSFQTTSDSTEASYSKSVWTLGGFSGFIYKFLASNDNTPHQNHVFIPSCGPREYWEDPLCKPCSASCGTWPWCIRGSDCSICAISFCTCTGYAPSLLTNCRRMLDSAVTFPNVIGLQSCPSMYITSAGACILSDSSQITTTLHQATATSFPSTGYYFYFVDSSEILNAYERGAYFDGSAHMQSLFSFQFSPVSSYLFWVLRVNGSGNIFSKSVYGGSLMRLRN